MALEAVVYSSQDPFSYNLSLLRDCYPSLGGGGAAAAAAAALGGYVGDFNLQEDDKALLGILDSNNIKQQQGLHANSWDSSSPSMMQHAKEWDPNSSPEACTFDQSSFPGAGIYFPGMETPPPAAEAGTTTGRRKRRRTKSTKNKEEIENQRMTHIAVERNRRKQMNEYLAVLRSLMPPSYVQRGDQASIIGGAINFVKELEHLLQTMEANKKTKQEQTADLVDGFSSPFADFFSFPQYSTRPTMQSPGSSAEESSVDHHHQQQQQHQWAMADIEVTMVESHANLKILSKKRPRQLLKLMAGLQSLRLSILHLNVSTVDQMVLYSVSVKVEEGCLLNSVDDIAAAVNQMIHRIEEEAAAAAAAFT